jgi:pimeloyl-ACP methyl ester carboxylesterase
VSRFILAGLCGGAITGLLAGANDDRVDSLIGLGLPVILDSDQVDHTKYLTTGELDQWRKGYFAKLVDFKSWLRLLTFRSNFRVILKVLLGSLKPDARRPAPDRAPVQQQPANLNPLLVIAFDTLVSTRPILLIFSEADRLYSIYQERFAQPHQASLRQHQDKFEIHVVKDANHIFSLPEWEEGMFGHVASWLDCHYAVA